MSDPIEPIEPLETGVASVALAEPRLAGPRAIPLPEVHEPWPQQADLIMSALEAARFGMGRPVNGDRRAARRSVFRVKAALRLFSDRLDASPWVLFTRDVHPRGLGFIT